MKYFKFKCVFVVFSIIVFKETHCGPAGRIESDGSHLKRSVHQLLLPYFFGPRNHVPVYKNQFNSGHNHDFFDYPNFEEYLDHKGSSENFGNGKFIIPWLNTNNQETANDNQKKGYLPWGKNKDDGQSKEFGSDEGSDSNEDDTDDDLKFGYGGSNQFIHQNNGYNSNPGSTGFNFGHNHDFLHSFDYHHGFGHNHGYHHAHTPECEEDHGRRHPPRGHPPRGPPPRGPPPYGPPPPPPTPATTNRPITAPTTSVSIDPRLSTTELPAIDIRFGR